MAKAANAATTKRNLIRKKIQYEPDTAFAVLETIWARQRPEEQFTHRHMGHDSKGFTESDTETANALYERYEEAGRKWWNMSAVDVVRCQKMMPKYSAQYMKAQEEKLEKEAV
jgi:hypothetical protein